MFFVPLTGLASDNRYAPAGAVMPQSVQVMGGISQQEWDAMTPDRRLALESFATALAPSPPSAASSFLAAASAVSAGIGAYHGYKRNQSVGWALWWAFAGGAAPIVVPAIAVAQGFGKPARKGT